jgi:hypothetical protein
MVGRYRVDVADHQDMERIAAAAAAADVRIVCLNGGIVGPPPVPRGRHTPSSGSGFSA